MRKKIILYILFVLLFALGKYVFMLYYHDIFGAYSGGDWWAVLYHGLPHDLTCAGYLMALPFLLQLVNIWIPGRWHLHFLATPLPRVGVAQFPERPFPLWLLGVPARCHRPYLSV